MTSIQELIESYKEGRIFRDGAKIVIAGAPNAGKSSLLNALLNEDRAIVNEIPGTTRDIIEESLSIGGVMFRVVDTAGIRTTTDAVEGEGVKRTERQAQNCDILLLVLDVSRDLSKSEEDELVSLIKERTPASASKVVALNKIDLIPEQNGQITRRSEFVSDFPGVKISALTGEGLNNLKNELVKSVLHDNGRFEGRTTITSARHHDALSRAHSSLGLALESLQQGRSAEFVAVDLRRGLDCLGEITGEITTDEILNNIFSKFCIGK